MNILLGSKSPRRRELLKGAGIHYHIVDIDCDEDFPAGMPGDEVAGYLAEKKSNAFHGDWENTVLITADTVVFLDGEIINKPVDAADAMRMLGKLSGKCHSVFTGVCIRSLTEKHVFTDKTNVYFKELTPGEIEYYVSHYKPFDKAGAYGIQDWIGYTSVRRIEGDFYNVMGLPIGRVYDTLRQMGVITLR